MQYCVSSSGLSISIISSGSHAETVLILQRTWRETPLVGWRERRASVVPGVRHIRATWGSQLTGMQSLGWEVTGIKWSVNSLIWDNQPLHAGWALHAGASEMPGSWGRCCSWWLMCPKWTRGKSPPGHLRRGCTVMWVTRARPWWVCWEQRTRASISFRNYCFFLKNKQKPTTPLSHLSKWTVFLMSSKI